MEDRNGKMICVMMTRARKRRIEEETQERREKENIQNNANEEDKLNKPTMISKNITAGSNQQLKENVNIQNGTNERSKVNEKAVNAQTIEIDSSDEEEYVDAKELVEEITEEQDKKNILWSFHDSTLGGHRGMNQTYQRINQKYN